MISKLKCLNSEVNKAFSQNCLVALLFKTEKRKIESTIKFLSSSYYYLINQQQEIKEKIAAMDILETEYSNYIQIPIEEREKIISDFLAVVIGDYKNKIITAKSALTLVQQQEINIEHLEYDLFTSQNNKYLDTIKKIQNKVKEINTFIWAGPTMQPVIIPYSFIENMFKLQGNIEKSVAKINKCLHTYKGMEAVLSNKWCKDKRLLYIWFLTEPKKLLAAIQRLEDHLCGKTKPQEPILVEI